MSHGRRRSKTDLPAYTSAMEAAHVGEAPQPHCWGHSDEFVDYEAADMPDKELAELLCSRCPFKRGHSQPGREDYVEPDICGKNARHRKPEWGVLGGIAWVNGRQAHLMAADDPRLFSLTPIANSGLNV